MSTSILTMKPRPIYHSIISLLPIRNSFTSAPYAMFTFGPHITLRADMALPCMWDFVYFCSNRELARKEKYAHGK